jgi:hypothetical protein
MIKLIRHLWGVDESWSSTFTGFKVKGYMGIETPPPEPARRDEFKRLLADHGFDYIGMAFTGGANVSEHFDSMRRQIDENLSLRARQVTIHSGSDSWDRATADDFYARVVDFEKTCPIPIGHETHRGRTFFNPWTTRDVLTRFPALRLCCDYSHWVCVAERLLHDCEDILKLCAKHSIHIHARVGYAEGPQVPDPSAPEYETELTTHEKWWRMIRDAHSARGEKGELTITPEFGPPGYLHTLPHTNAPVADLTRVVDWMAERLRRVTFG